MSGSNGGEGGSQHLDKVGGWVMLREGRQGKYKGFSPKWMLWDLVCVDLVGWVPCEAVGVTDWVGGGI